MLLMLGAGCLGGGSSSSAGSAGNGPTRAQFRQQAVAICRRYQRRIGSLKTASDLAHLASQGARAVALERAELRELRALTPPAADRVAVTRMLDSLEQSIGTGAKLVAAAKANDAAGVAADAELLKAQLGTTGVLARPFGLDVCTS
ncbi:MAG TPA: hypothetical protein VFH74_11725 [Gaiellales bacterium]|nr:hypothetical protein [Gaiellales bacterium]